MIHRRLLAMCRLVDGRRDLGPRIAAHTADGNIRQGPSANTCSSNGQGQVNQHFTYSCWAFGSGGPLPTWTYGRDVATGIIGWVNDAYLSPHNGSLFHCS